MKFIPKKCENCNQTTEYMLALDRGTCNIVKCFATRVRIKGINVIHPKKEMEVPHKEWNYKKGFEEGVLTSTQIGNLTRARIHGLLARIKGEPGNWCITQKGALFLKGNPILQYAIMDKRTRQLKRYAWGECPANMKSHSLINSHVGVICKNCDAYIPREIVAFISDFKSGSEYWIGINYTIESGRVVYDVKDKKAVNSELF
ncbi:hypothetical protein LCGC14_2532250 [marine sediment metagenome]|uniref:Uncharacterized protein n=1 Tax=marine sediment metagenome TaxID=412755 RepID=A0A0F9ATN8_9ZZZZ